MPNTVEAIYEDGVLKPLEKLDIEEHQKVNLSIIVPRKEPAKELPKALSDLIEMMEHPVTQPVEKMAKNSEIEVD